ncbi:MAG TPA: hypothetical protein VF092_04090 [Longimicrobium sp.]
MTDGERPKAMEIRIEPVTEAHVESFHRCFEAVARERRWLALFPAPPTADS